MWINLISVFAYLLYTTTHALAVLFRFTYTILFITEIIIMFCIMSNRMVNAMLFFWFITPDKKISTSPCKNGHKLWKYRISKTPEPSFSYNSYLRRIPLLSKHLSHFLFDVLLRSDLNLKNLFVSACFNYLVFTHIWKLRLRLHNALSNVCSARV